MMDNKINLIIDGIPVTGEITHRSSRDIDVQICTPYKNLSNSRHIPSMAAGYRSFVGTKGNSVAEELLKELYSICQYIDTHSVTLATNLAELLGRSEYPVKQAELLAQMKDAKPASSVKTQHIKGLKRKIDTQLETQLREFLAGAFPMRISKNMEKPILAAIQGTLAFE